MKFANRVAAETRLAAVATLRDRHLLAVDVELELAVPHPLARGRPEVGGVGAHAGRQRRERHPVAAVDRQLLRLPRVDVAAHARRCDVEERRVAGHRDRLLHVRRRQLEIDQDLLPHEQLDALAIDASEPGHRHR